MTLEEHADDLRRIADDLDAHQCVEVVPLPDAWYQAGDQPHQCPPLPDSWYDVWGIPACPPPPATGAQYYGADYRPPKPLALRIVPATPSTFAAAVADSRPGDRIELASGQYGRWFLNGPGIQGNATDRVVITPAAGATVEFTEIDIQENCSHLWLGQFHGEPQYTNFIVDRGGTGGGCLSLGWSQHRSGTRAHQSVDNVTVCGVHLTNVGYNTLIIKGGATDIDVFNTRFTRVGMTHPDRGEHVYIGQSNGAAYPSPNERIRIQGCLFESATADVVDIKPSNIQGIEILDNYIEIADFDGTSEGFTNAAVGVTQLQSVQVRDPKVKILRTVIRDISETGANARACGITTWMPCEIAYNIIYRTGRWSIRLDASTTPLPSWWTPDIKFDVHHNTFFDHDQMSGGYEPVSFGSFGANDAARLRFVGNITGAVVNLPSGTAEASNNHVATLTDFVGPTSGDANAGPHVGSGYAVASGSPIPPTAGAL